MKCRILLQRSSTFCTIACDTCTFAAKGQKLQPMPSDFILAWVCAMIVDSFIPGETRKGVLGSWSDLPVLSKGYGYLLIIAFSVISHTSDFSHSCS
ncbi:MAG: hypothetical protein ABJB16_12560 [Saprospiraceae bacterium]